jgi:hypothetical protein
LQRHLLKGSPDVINIKQYSALYGLLWHMRRAAVLPGGQRQCAGGYCTVATEACPDTEATRRYSGNRGPYSGLERRELKGGASRRI